MAAKRTVVGGEPTRKPVPRAPVHRQITIRLTDREGRSPGDVAEIVSKVLEDAGFYIHSMEVK